MKPDDLLIDNPIALVDRLFGPERQLQGQWLMYHEAGAPHYQEPSVDDDFIEDDDDALAPEGELCPQEE